MICPPQFPESLPGWGAGAKTLHTAALTLIYSTAKYCTSVWCHSPHLLAVLRLKMVLCLTLLIISDNNLFPNDPCPHHYWVHDNLSANQFGKKINKNDLPSLALKRKQKSFVMPQRQLKRQL